MDVWEPTNSWRRGFMIPDLYSGTAVDLKEPLYHCCLEVGFQELKELQDSPIILDIQFGNYNSRALQTFWIVVW
jgi:hypothetical protein